MNSRTHITTCLPIYSLWFTIVNVLGRLFRWTEWVFFNRFKNIQKSFLPTFGMYSSKARKNHRLVFEQPSRARKIKLPRNLSYNEYCSLVDLIIKSCLKTHSFSYISQTNFVFTKLEKNKWNTFVKLVNISN